MAGSKPAALPLGDTPASASPALVAGAHLTAAGASPPARKLRVHGRAVEPARHVAPPAIGNLRREALGFDRARALGEYARARQPGGRPPRQPLQRLRHFGIARPHHRLAVVAAAGLKKGAYCDEGGITCQFRALEHLPGTDRDTRVDDHVPTGWECLGAEALPHALRPGRETLNKNRDIRTEREAQSGELRHRESAAPERIEREQRSGGVGAPPA